MSHLEILILVEQHSSQVQRCRVRRASAFLLVHPGFPGILSHHMASKPDAGWDPGRRGERRCRRSITAWSLAGRVPEVIKTLRPLNRF